MRIIIIAGPSGSGKTSLAKKLSRELSNSYIISTDNFYKIGILSNFLSKLIKSYFDRKISLNGKLLKKTVNKILKNKKIDYSYEYDFIKKRTEIIYENPRIIDNLIIEGIFVLELLKSISIKNYLLIRLEISKDICMKRIYERDYYERGKNKIRSIEDFKRAWNIYKNKEKSYKGFIHGKELIFKNDPNINNIIKNISNKN